MKNIKEKWRIDEKSIDSEAIRNDEVSIAHLSAEIKRVAREGLKVSLKAYQEAKKLDSWERSQVLHVLEKIEKEFSGIADYCNQVLDHY